MQVELHVSELESEVCVLLPERSLLRRHRGARASARASFGSAANANATNQSNSNGQFVVNTGRLHEAGIHVESNNENNNSNTQTAMPINFTI